MSGLEVVGWFASPLIDRVFGLACTLLEQTGGSNQEAKMILFQMKTLLLTVKGAIEALEARPVPSQTLPGWLKEFKDVAYEALDVLDIIEYKNMCDKFTHQGKVSIIASNYLSAIRSLIYPDSDLENLKVVANNLKIICGEVGNLVQLLNLKDNYDQRAKKRPKTSENTHHLDDLVLFGRDEERNTLLDMMGIPMNNPESSQKNIIREDLETSNKGTFSRKGKQPSLIKKSSNNLVLGVISIVGIAGVGKTALAKIIYSDQNVIKHFDLRSWVYVPETKATETVFRRVIESIEPDGPVLDFNAGLYLYRGRFDRIIKDKRVLLVMDNMWEGDLDWGYLHRVLVAGVAPGSIVIVTTQSHRVAKKVGTMTHIGLNVLQHNNFLQLFEHYAFGKENISDDKRNSLQLIGKEIVEKLNGLPLAAVAVGSLLRQKLDRENWRTILESDWWNIGSNSGEVLPSLAVSFQQLDIELRQCFAFCSLLPRGVFIVDDLFELWIAHDLIKPIMGRSNNLRGFTKELFNHLSERCLFQPIIRGATFYMPDSVRDFAVALSSNEMCIIKNEKIHIPQTVRHLTLFSNEFCKVEWGDYKMERLRTLLVYCGLKIEGYHILKSILSKSTKLRVLDLSYVVLEKEPPHVISSLLHLRSLNLAYTGIEVFPKSFCRLFHLRILNLKGCELRELPKEFNMLTNLHFLHAHQKVIAGIYGIGKLTKLQSLSTFSLRNEDGFRLTELKGMNEIDGCLRIENLGKISGKEEAIGAKLLEKKFLRRIELVWNFPLECSDVNVLEDLMPHAIEELVIENYGGTTFHAWMLESYLYTNLQFICLRKCALVVMPNLGQLPSLAVLKIESLNSITHIGCQIYGNGMNIFPSLKELSFSSMSHLVEWLPAKASQFITGLKKLNIMKCEKLRRIPFQSLGPGVIDLEISNCGPFADEMCRYFERLDSLTSLKVSKCQQSISLPCYNLRVLEYLYLHDCDSVHFAGGLKSLVKLKKLEISQCRKLDESLHLERPSIELGMASLINLKIDHSNSLNYPDALGTLPLLRILKVCGPIELNHRPWFSNLTSLEELEISSTSCLPSNLESLPSLKKLTINKCQIYSLPYSGLPHGLKELYITKCSEELKNRCRHPSGEDWPKIAHVPYIRVDYKTIQML